MTIASKPAPGDVTVMSCGRIERQALPAAPPMPVKSEILRHETTTRLDRAVDQVGGAEKGRNEAVGWTIVEFDRRTDLLDAALVEHGDPVGDGIRLFLVVGNIDRGDPELALQRLELGTHLDPKLGIEVGERLIEQQHIGLDHEGSCERDALLLAAR